MDARRIFPLRLFSAIVILASCIGCDQATKAIATRELQDGPARSYFGDVLRFEYAENPGGFLSLGDELPKHVRNRIFTGFGACLMGLLAGYLIFKRQASPAMFAAMAFMLAGGIGNLIDRVCRDGLVTDFINIGIGPIRTGIFNVADMAIIFGAAAAVLLSLGRDAGTRQESVA